MGLSSEVVEAKTRELRLLLLDVDGVLTDGTLTVHADGSDAKSFFIRDGSALVWAQREGLEVGILSGRQSKATSRRAAELGITLVVQGQSDKREAYLKILTKRGLTDSQVAFMGDDLLDLPVLTRVGLSAAPSDAAAEVRARVDWISQYGGGRGAVRELVELVLKSRGRWDALIGGYLA